MKICLVSSEFAPLAKTGGLADVSAALSAYLHKAGHDVRVLLPLYSAIDTSKLNLKPVDYLQDMSIELGRKEVHFSIDTALAPGTDLPIYFLRCPEAYDRDSIYTQNDDEHARFVLLSRAAIEMCQRMGFGPDVFHCNDWHTALVPLYLKTLYSWDKLFEKTATALTIHNIGYQGIFNSSILTSTGLSGCAERLHQDDLRLGRINFLKTGILYADVVTTVSPTYAREIMSEEYGMGLQDLLQQRSSTVVGILNGVDYGEWDPSKDAYIPHRFSRSNLTAKEENKRELMAELDLKYEPDVPLIGQVSRLTFQKGIDLVQQVLPTLIQKRKFAMAILGNGEARYEQFYSWLQNRYRDRICFYRGYSEKLAHQIEAASDMFLMPSRYEPCGLNQMYSLRYGTVPIVRKTGGLADSVQLWNPKTGQGTGIVFGDYNTAGLTWAINAALDLYSDRRGWRKMMRNGMAMDYSWDRQGRIYTELYKKISESK